MARILYTYAGILTAFILAGCSEREPTLPIARMGVSDGGMVEPLAVPRFNPMLVGDQAANKTPANAAADANLTALLASMPKPHAEMAESGEGDGAEAGEGAVAKAVQGIKEKMFGGKSKSAKSADEEGEGEGEKDGEKVAADMSNLLHDARPEVKEIPKNPADRPSQGIQLAHQAALKAASAALVKTAMGLQIEENSGTTLGMAVTKEAGKDSTSLENLNPKGMRVVGMKWKDADTLEVEMEISVGDIADAAEKVAPKIELDAFRTQDEEKCVSAMAVGIIPPGMRTANKAAPGERAKDAAEGGF